MELSKILKARLGLFIFVFLLLVGIFIRVWKIDSTPISLFGDEIDVGLQAYSIATTGKDYFGNRYPIMFHSFSEYRLPMQLYLDAPFVKLVGLNAYGVRPPSLIMGLLSLLLFYFLVRELFDKKLALITTIFLAFSPWHINFSRQANDAGIILPFIIGGTLFFLKGIKEYKYLLISTFLFAMSFYSYAIATVFTPLFALSLIVIYRKRVFRYQPIKLILLVILGLLLLLPYIIFTYKGISSQRFSNISAIQEDFLMGEVVARRRWSESFLTRVFYNRKTIATEVVLKNYVKSFSVSFLFTEGDPNMRQSIEGFGQMYHFDIVLIFLGLWFLFYKNAKEKANEKYLLVFSFLAISPLASALTKDGGTHASRLILMVIPLVILSGIGFKVLLESTKGYKKKVLVAIFITVAVLDITRFIHRYFVIWKNESWRFFQYGFEEAVSYVNENENDYQKVIFDSTYEPMLPRFLFYSQYDMRLFQKQFSGDRYEDNIINGVNGFSLTDKYYFGELAKPIENLATPGTLVIANGEKDVTNPGIFNNSNLKLLKVISSPTNIPIFYIFTANNAGVNN